MDGIVGALIFNIEISKIWVFYITLLVYMFEQITEKSINYWLNGVALDRHGVIPWENEATGSRKVSKYLLGPMWLLVGSYN